MAMVIDELLLRKEGTGRCIFVGDVHGCIDEVSELLAKVGVGRDDTVVSVGDLVRKGPDPVGCLELWRSRGYYAVLGNNEEKMLRNGKASESAVDRALAERPDLLSYIASFPIVIDLPQRGLAVVHGGLMPGMSVDETDVGRHRDVLTKLRYIRREGDGWRNVPKGEEHPGDRLWAQEWRGDRYVLYGHTPLVEPRYDELALGLDTGCVYGRRLTAGVWKNGEWDVVSVKARRAYST
jgi:hypothetical protein